MKAYMTRNTEGPIETLGAKGLSISRFSSLCGLTMLALTCVSGSLLADSQDSALYDLAPEGAAFVRVINLRQSASEVALADQSLKIDEYCSASRYHYFSAGDYQVLSRSLQLSARLDSHSAYSIVIEDDQISLINDAYVQDRKLSLVSAYNFSQSKSLALKTADGKHTVFSDLNPLEQKSRTINPVKAQFSLFLDNLSVLEVKPIIFERGVASSLLICGDDEPVKSRWVRQ